MKYSPNYLATFVDTSVETPTVTDRIVVSQFADDEDRLTQVARLASEHEHVTIKRLQSRDVRWIMKNATDLPYCENDLVVTQLPKGAILPSELSEQLRQYPAAVDHYQFNAAALI